ncbi:MAG: hypothetical protein IPP81_09130 [Chitinophagaceae bacterium]|nr:hypothetical protein [Chitinophagaceae bacterium]
MPYKQNHTGQPTFLVYPKRKSAGNPSAVLYMQFNYQLNKINKCLGIEIDVRQWCPVTHTVIGQPMHNQLLFQKVEEYKQKLMGAYYMLVQNGGQVTLREIVDMAFGKADSKIYSLFSVFGDMILRMEKMIEPGKSRANLIKHRSCLNHLKKFCSSAVPVK